MEQLAIALTGGVAIWLANDARSEWRKWACIFGLAGQPFWFYSSFVGKQWGILALTILYTFAWLKGVKVNWLQNIEVHWRHKKREVI